MIHDRGGRIRPPLSVSAALLSSANSTRWRIAVALACTVCLTHVAAAAEAPHLRDFIARAKVVGAGQVGEVVSYANGRLSVAPLKLTAVFKTGGEEKAGSSINVIELRDLPIPPLLASNTYVVAFVAPTRKTSFLRATLPDGEYLQAVGKPPGWLVAESADELAQMADIVGRVAKASSSPELDPEKRRAGVRTLTFDLIAAHHPLLVEDGAASLDDIPDLKKTLTSAEEDKLAAALDRTDLPARVQVALIRAIGANGLVQLAPQLAKVTSPDGQAAAWEALAQLGKPLTNEQMKQALASRDAATRINAARELLQRDGAAAIDTVAPVALHDPDPGVRTAAIRALGKTKSPEALVPLERAFQDADPELRQQVGRAMTEVGGREAAESFARLAFEGPLASQRYAVLLLLLSGTPKDDPLVQRIATQHPDEQVRKLITEGLPKPES